MSLLRCRGPIGMRVTTGRRARAALGPHEQDGHDQGPEIAKHMAESAATGHGSVRGTRFALTKFRPPPLPATLITRSELHERLAAGSGQRLTVVVGSAGAGKSVLLADWAAARPPGATSWLSCDRADADPVRFWAGFIEAPRAIEKWFGADAADLLTMDRRMSADVTASVANDAAQLPAGSVIIVDDFHFASAAVAPDMADLVERWPAETVQLVLAGRFDPPLRQHRLRMSGQLREVRDRDLYFSLTESRDLLANFGVQLSAADLALLHQRSEGWPAVLQMAALSLRGTTDPERLERVLEVRGQAIAEYFVSEVLDQQPAEVAQFMLDTSILEVLTVEACAAVAGRQDAAALLRAIGTAHLFLVALDDERTSFRYHHLVRRVLRAELRARDRAREHALQLRAAEWYEATGDPRRAAYHYLAAQQADRGLALLQDRVVPDFLQAPTVTAPLVLSMADPSLLVQTPERLLGLAADLLLSGDTAHGGEYLDLLERAGKIPAESKLAARFAAFQSFRYGVAGQLERAVQAALDARAIQERTQLTDEWNSVVTLILIRVYNCLDDFPAAEREAAAALARPRCRRISQARDGAGCAGAGVVRGRPPDRGRRYGQGRRGRCAAAGVQPALLRRRPSARAVRPRAGTARPRHGRASHRTRALHNRAAPAALRIPGAAGPGADLGGPRAGPRRAGDRRRPHARSCPGPARPCWPGPTSRRRCSACRSATCAPPPSWPPGCPPPGAACYWPGSPWPPVIARPCRNTCRRRRWAT